MIICVFCVILCWISGATAVSRFYPASDGKIMTVNYCYICNQHPDDRSGSDAALAEGDYCPICNQPACRSHLSVVRWRWRESGMVDSALVCRECVRTYAHRSWDVFRRDWIT